jgi:nucleotide-binding universal stress UspA family protein
MTAPEPNDTRFKRILFCTDFSESADGVFDFAIDATIRRPGSSLYILHVIPEVEAQFWKSYLYEVDNIDDQARRSIDEKVATTYLPRVPEGMEVKVEIRAGPEATRILEFAAENNIDLIIVGREGSSGWHKALFGKVAEKIVRHAKCPVLVVPAIFHKSPAVDHGG